MEAEKTKFALFFGNRGFFPASLIAEARDEVPKVLVALGHEVLMLGKDATRYGAVETTEDGRKHSEFLARNRGAYGGVILCLPNFGDESGAVAALKDCGVPILVQAYPDDLARMAPELRRDAFCGKISVMDVFHQYGVKFTALKPHVVRPKSDQFKANVDHFDRVCRVVNGLRGMVVGAIGARTTPFKTVRVDELALQRSGITVESLDLSDVISRAKAVSPGSAAYRAKAKAMKGCASWEGVPQKALDAITRLGVVLDQVVKEWGMDAVALRCWTELQSELGISPCVLLGEMNDRGLTAACELDVGSAITMHALSLASGRPAACLDWNNNYGDDEDKCILFHCGPVPRSLMSGKGRITDHAILRGTVGRENSYGCNVGRIGPGDFTFGDMVTEAGRLKFYLGQGRFTEDPIPEEFFGCAGVAEIEGLQEVLLHIGEQGHRHHVAVTPGLVMEPVREALERYLGFGVVVPQEG